MRKIDVAIIGAGQAGLAMSKCLSLAGIEHVILERGRLAERWRSERWDSLKLLTPNWLSRLPGWRYQGDDPDGYMSSLQLVRYLESYASSFSAPIHSETTLLSAERVDTGYHLRTDRGNWLARVVVIATGYANQAAIPDFANALPSAITQVVPTHYRNPTQLPEGGVLVVGASSTGVQLAEEIHASGRPVTLSVGKHTRLPRRYRGQDILWWLDRMGLLDERVDDVYDLQRSRREPSLQLVGREDGRDIDLASLKRGGIALAGKTFGIHGNRVLFADDLGHSTGAADEKLRGILGRIENFASRENLSGLGPRPDLEAAVMAPGPVEIDLGRANIKSVVWCTGYRRSYPWLRVPVLDERGELRHRYGITPSPGLYALGLMFMHRRSSNFLDGVGRDAEFLVPHILANLDQRAARAA
jgi:putative flavoprotein involved in K+ transport